MSKLGGFNIDFSRYFTTSSFVNWKEKRNTGFSVKWFYESSTNGSKMEIQSNKDPNKDPNNFVENKKFQDIVNIVKTLDVDEYWPLIKKI